MLSIVFSVANRGAWFNQRHSCKVRRRDSVKPKFINRLIAELSRTRGTGDSWKYFETPKFWNLRDKSKDELYRIHKIGIAPEHLSVSQKFVDDEIRQIVLHSPDLKPESLWFEAGENPRFFSSGEEVSGECHVVIRMPFLQERNLLKNLLDKGRFTEKHLDALVSFFQNYHSQAPVLQSKHYNHAEEMKVRTDNLIYQSEKHQGLTTTQSTIDLIKIPLMKFLRGCEKELKQRLKKNAVLGIAGDMDAEHLYAFGDGFVLSPSIHLSAKDAYLDVLEDAASLQAELLFHDRSDLSNRFLEKYREPSGTRHPDSLCRFFSAYKSLQKGLAYTVNVARNPEDGRSAEKAMKYYKLSAFLAKELGAR